MKALPYNFSMVYFVFSILEKGVLAWKQTQVPEVESKPAFEGQEVVA